MCYLCCGRGDQNIEASFICIDENNRLVKEMKAHSGSYTNQEDKSRDETVESLGPYTNQEDESRVASVESLGPYTNQEDESHDSSMDSVGLDTNDENDSQASSCESVLRSWQLSLPTKRGEGRH
jgi:hypothetical protein